MTARVAVREFQADEWPVFRDLRLRALADSPDSFARTLAEEENRTDAEWSKLLIASAASPARISLRAERDQRAVGLAHGRIAPEAPAVAQLYAMWVEPAARRRGVGRGLVDAVAVWARSAGARCLILRVTEGNTPAVRLYEHAGFLPTSERARLRPNSSLYIRTLRLEL
jgi:ribosomal protein S18 acetylase RimI-like enzyme